jgi:putative ABC transport system permease protein
MGAIWVRMRAEVRSRWRALVVLSLLAGLPAGVAIASASGASRTDTVIDRLVAATKPPLVYMIPALSETPPRFEDVARLPNVSEAILLHGYDDVTRGEELEIIAPVGLEIPANRSHLISGRRPRAGSADEAIVNFHAADQFRWKIGDVVPMTLAATGSDLFGDGERRPGPSVRAKIVGIYADTGDFVGVAGSGMQFGPGFDRTYSSTAASFDFYVFSLRHGAADIAAFEEHVLKLTGGELPIGAYGDAGIGQIRRTFHVQAAAMWLLCILISLVAGFIFAQSFVRQTLLESNEHSVLRALGMRRWDLRMHTAIRGAIVAIAAVGIAAIVGALLSYFTPLGTPRLAEPRPGLWIPARIYGVGLAAVIVAVLMLAVPPSWIAAGAVKGEARAARERPSSIARFVGVMTGRPGPAVGARFALEPGRGASAVPIRSSLATSITGIVALMAALIVAASLSHLLVTPSLYGWNWDALIPGSFEAGSADIRDLMSDPAVAEISLGSGDSGFRVGKLITAGIAAERVKGDIEPTLLSGRAPGAADEVALGPKIAQALHLRLGNSVVVGYRTAEGTQRMRLVGEVVLPFDDDTTTVGEGLWMTLAGLRAINPGAEANTAAVRLAPGVARKATIARLTNRFPGEALSGEVPQTVNNFGRMSNLPTVLASLLAALAAATLAHMLATSIRRRRRDLAILKTFGFSRRQVRSAVEWQAAIFTAVALAIAIPLGIVVGRWIWTLIARYGGFAPDPTVPTPPIALTALGALAVAVVLAMLPARSAARTKPALVLRSE